MPPKIKRVYHFLAADWALKDIKERRLKISRLSALNDPFEFLRFNISDRAERGAYSRVRDEFGETNGLICFCDTWRSPLTWAHYGDRYRGICLGFDVPAEELTAITYVKRRERAPNIIAATPEERLRIAKRLTSIKFDHWRYEGEHRLYVPLDEQDADGHFYFAFGDQLRLKEVLVGAKATTSRHEVASALGGLSSTVSSSKTRPGFGRFGMVVNRAKSAWK